MRGDSSAPLGRLVARLILPLLLDVFRFLSVQCPDRIARTRLRMNQFVEFRVDRLSIAMFGTLDEQRHEPRRENGNRVPVERLGLKSEPKNGIGGDDRKPGCVVNPPSLVKRRRIACTIAAAS